MMSLWLSLFFVIVASRWNLCLLWLESRTQTISEKNSKGVTSTHLLHNTATGKILSSGSWLGAFSTYTVEFFFVWAQQKKQHSFCIWHPKKLSTYMRQTFVFGHLPEEDNCTTRKHKWQCYIKTVVSFCLIDFPSPFSWHR